MPSLAYAERYEKVTGGVRFVEYAEGKEKEMSEVSEHNYVFQKICESDERAQFYHIVFCTKCGYVAWFGNNTKESMERMQSNLPKSCTTPGTPTEGEERE